MSQDALVGKNVEIKSTGDYVIPGSAQVMCQDCPTMLWIAPSSRSLVASHPNIAIVCPSCASKRIANRRAGELFEVEPPTPAQLEEIAEARGVNQ